MEFRFIVHHVLNSWGRNKEGQLGVGHFRDMLEPTRVLAKADMCSISCGEASATAVTASGDVWSWGSILKNYEKIPQEKPHLVLKREHFPQHVHLPDVPVTSLTAVMQRNTANV